MNSFWGHSPASIQPPRMVRYRFCRGLTLLETMLALVLLSLMIVGVLGLLGSLLVSSTKSTDSTAATFVGQNLLEQAHINGPPALDEDGVAVFDGVESLKSHEEELPVNFRYRMTWTRMGDIATYNNGSGTPVPSQFGSELYLVNVEIWWMVENSQDGRAEGGGLRTLKLERIVNYTPSDASGEED